MGTGSGCSSATGASAVGGGIICAGGLPIPGSGAWVAPGACADGGGADGSSAALLQEDKNISESTNSARAVSTRSASRSLTFQLDFWNIYVSLGALGR